MTEFNKKNPIVQKIWDRLRTLIGAKVHKIKNTDDLEKVAKKYKTLNKFEKNKLIQKSNLVYLIKDKATIYQKPYRDKNGVEHKGYYKNSPIPWTKKEDAQIQIYKQRGRTLNQMSFYTSRTPSSIRTRLSRLKNKK